MDDELSAAAAAVAAPMWALQAQPIAVVQVPVHLGQQMVVAPLVQEARAEMKRKHPQRKAAQQSWMCRLCLSLALWCPFSRYETLPWCLQLALTAHVASQLALWH